MVNLKIYIYTHCIGSQISLFGCTWLQSFALLFRSSYILLGSAQNKLDTCSKT